MPRPCQGRRPRSRPRPLRGLARDAEVACDADDIAVRRDGGRRLVVAMVDAGVRASRSCSVRCGAALLRRRRRVSLPKPRVCVGQALPVVASEGTDLDGSGWTGGEHQSRAETWKMRASAACASAKPGCAASAARAKALSRSSSSPRDSRQRQTSSTRSPSSLVRPRPPRPGRRGGRRPPRPPPVPPRPGRLAARRCARSSTARLQLERREQPFVGGMGLGVAPRECCVVVVGRPALVRADVVLEGVVDEREEAQVGPQRDAVEDRGDVRSHGALGMSLARRAPRQAGTQSGVGA